MDSSPRPRLYINHIPELDWLIALEFGRVDEGQPREHWLPVGPQFGYLRESTGGRAVGFKIIEFSGFDVECEAVHRIWEEPLFDAPTLGLTAEPAGAVASAVRAFNGERHTLNRVHFNAAVGASEGEKQIEHWLGCLEAGDCMAHYGLGIALLEQHVTNRAYAHLRYYAECAPRKAWAHHWHARAALAIGALDEARAALARSIELETSDELMNQSRMLLAEIRDRE